MIFVVVVLLKYIVKKYHVIAINAFEHQMYLTSTASFGGKILFDLEF